MTFLSGSERDMNEILEIYYLNNDIISMTVFRCFGNRYEYGIKNKWELLIFFNVLDSLAVIDFLQNSKKFSRSIVIEI